MSIFFDHFVHSHDPMLGVHATNLASELDVQNWSNKALLSGAVDGRHYIYINHVACSGEPKKYFCVNIFSLYRQEVAQQRLFALLDDALICANQLVSRQSISQQVDAA